ncbi:hypothetical protein ACN0IV_14220 [Trabulsiella odontotermitis]|uniref:hypothetical protein n=1 Tax=Trabulsiella odontotermitis TaxID=379893 RepID=UPI003AD3ED52
MKYPDNSNILLGDIVTLGGGMTGVVVCNFENEEFANGFNKDEWGHFKTGIMVKSSQAGLVYYAEDCIDLTLVKRAVIHSGGN